jgi:hypothetical protein
MIKRELATRFPDWPTTKSPWAQVDYFQLGFDAEFEARLNPRQGTSPR